MGQFLYLLTSFLFFMLITYAVLRVIYRKELAIDARIKRYSLIKQPTASHKLAKEKKVKAKSSLYLLPQRYLPNLRKYILKKMSKQSMAYLNKQLRAAGQPYGLTPVDFRILQFGLAIIIFLIIGILALPGSDNPRQTFYLAIVAGLIGAIYPNIALNTKKKKRTKEIEGMMPDFFDMITISLEAGMGLDAAINTTCQKFNGALSDEFLQTLGEMKLGKSRREAFTSLRDRIGSDSFQSIMNTLIQSDQLGIGMANVFRSLTIRIREKQREIYREKAMKVPVKMLLPIVFFIFPAIFIVILGPMAIKFIMGDLGL